MIREFSAVTGLSVLAFLPNDYCDGCNDSEECQVWCCYYECVDGFDETANRSCLVHPNVRARLTMTTTYETRFIAVEM